MFRYGDILIYGGLIIFALLPFFKKEEIKSEIIQINFNNDTFLCFADKDTLIELKNGKIIAEIKDGKVRIKDSDCRDKYCVKQGWLDAGSSRRLICMPNRLIIEFAQKENNAIDAVTE
ncbi:MAG TPA: NusG domain II-containing protein [Clostridiales bacterium]|nr:NusG domain II-containing protein [Clostridiales bacterium]HQP70038.1 NusG domain II-containing protein [Clostridiales bacterium]